MRVHPEFSAYRTCGVLTHEVELVHGISQLVRHQATERVLSLIQRLRVLVVEERGVEAIQ